MWYLLNALHKLPLYHGEVYRGVQVNLPTESYLKGMNIYPSLQKYHEIIITDTCAGKQVCWNALTSTSLTKSVAEGFMKTKNSTAPSYLFVLDVVGERLVSIYIYIRFAVTSFCFSRLIL